MEITRNQISVIIGIIGFVLIGTAFFFWNIYTPSKTPEEKRLDAYYRCISYNVLPNNNINNCNLIK